MKKKGREGGVKERRKESEKEYASQISVTVTKYLKKQLNEGKFYFSS
jgi:hypothetical protein